MNQSLLEIVNYNKGRCGTPPISIIYTTNRPYTLYNELQMPDQKELDHYATSGGLCSGKGRGVTPKSHTVINSKGI